MLPPIDFVIRTYSKYIEREDVDSANRFLASVAMVASFAASVGTLSPEEASKYIEELREKVVEGPENINPYVFGLLGEIADDPTNLDKIKERFKEIICMEQLGLED